MPISQLTLAFILNSLSNKHLKDTNYGLLPNIEKKVLYLSTERDFMQAKVFKADAEGV